jgi:hypothetical protein
MIINIKRKASYIGLTFGELSISGVVLGVTLERDAVAIPAGTYPARLYNSPKEGREVVRLVNVPDRTDIEIHVGNYGHDTLGCILIGLTSDIVGQRIYSSIEAFNLLMQNVKRLSTPGHFFTVIVEGDAPCQR